MPKRKNQAVVVDIDGTLLLRDLTNNDKLIKTIKHMRERYMYHIIILTARPKNTEAEIRKILTNLGIRFELLITRPTMNTDQTTYKLDAIKHKIMPTYDIKYIFDDDQNNIRAFYLLNLRAIAVNPETGDFRL